MRIAVNIAKDLFEMIGLSKVVTIHVFKLIFIILPLVSCVKRVQIQIFFWSVLYCIPAIQIDLWCKFPFSVRIQENTDHKKLCIWALFMQ